MPDMAFHLLLFENQQHLHAMTTEIDAELLSAISDSFSASSRRKPWTKEKKRPIASVSDATSEDPEEEKREEDAEVLDVIQDSFATSCRRDEFFKTFRSEGTDQDELGGEDAAAAADVELSEEQQAAEKLLFDDQLNLVIAAIPGAGKTEWNTRMARRMARKAEKGGEGGDTIIFQFSASLKMQTRRKIEAWKSRSDLQDVELQRIEACSFHSAAHSYFISKVRDTGNVDEETLVKILRDPSTKPDLKKLRNVKLVIVDECQDLTPIYAFVVQWVLWGIWEANDQERFARVVLVGDPRQQIFGFTGTSLAFMLDPHCFFSDKVIRKFPESEPATSFPWTNAKEFIDNSRERFGSLTPWTTHAFTYSYRLGSRICAWMNRNLSLTELLSRVEERVAELPLSDQRAQGEHLTELRRLVKKFGHIEIRSGKKDPGEVRMVWAKEPSEQAVFVAEIITKEKKNIANVALLAHSPKENSALGKLVTALEHSQGVSVYKSNTFGASGTGQHLRGGRVYSGSIHSAKGLEWPRVVMVGFTNSFIGKEPANLVKDAVSMFKLYYVGVSRALKELTVILAGMSPFMTYQDPLPSGARRRPQRKPGAHAAAKKKAEAKAKGPVESKKAARLPVRCWTPEQLFAHTTYDSKVEQCLTCKDLTAQGAQPSEEWLFPPAAQVWLDSAKQIAEDATLGIGEAIRLLLECYIKQVEGGLGSPASLDLTPEIKLIENEIKNKTWSVQTEGRKVQDSLESLVQSVMEEVQTLRQEPLLKWLFEKTDQKTSCVLGSLRDPSQGGEPRPEVFLQIRPGGWEKLIYMSQRLVWAQSQRTFEPHHKTDLSKWTAQNVKLLNELWNSTLECLRNIYHSETAESKTYPSWFSFVRNLAFRQRRSLALQWEWCNWNLETNIAFLLKPSGKVIQLGFSWETYKTKLHTGQVNAILHNQSVRSQKGLVSPVIESFLILPEKRHVFKCSFISEKEDTPMKESSEKEEEEEQEKETKTPGVPLWFSYLYAAVLRKATTSGYVKPSVAKGGWSSTREKQRIYDAHINGAGWTQTKLSFARGAAAFKKQRKQ